MGVRTNNLTETSLADDLVVNRDQSTRRQPVLALATQLAGNGAIAEALSALDERSGTSEGTLSAHGERLDTIESEQTDMAGQITALEGQAYAAGPIYADTAAGLAAVSEGLQFKVENADPAVSYDVYRHDAGPTATPIASVLSPAALASAYELALSTGDLFATASVQALNLTNGATGSGWEIVVPIGVQGNSSFCQPLLPNPGLGAVGDTVRVTLEYEVSATFTRPLEGYFFVKTASALVSRSATLAYTEHDGEVVATADYVLQGDELYFAPYFRIGWASGNVTSVEERIELVGLRIALLNRTSARSSIGDETADNRAARFLAAIRADDLPQLASGPGDMLSDVTYTLSLAAGAVARADELGAQIGYDIPVGFAGNGTAHYLRWSFDGAEHAGKTLRVRFLYRTSSTLTRTFSKVAQVTDTLGATARVVTSADTLVVPASGWLLRTIEYTCDADDAVFVAALVQTSSSVTAGTEYIEAVAFWPEWLTSNRAGQTIAQANTDHQNARLLGVAAKDATERALGLSRVPALLGHRNRKLAAVGGDFSSFSTALAAIADANAGNIYDVVVDRGVFAEAELFDQDHVNFRGVGAGQTVIDFAQPDGANASDLQTYSAIKLRRNSRWEGMTIRTRNGRYGVHWESSGGWPNRVGEVVNCRIEHNGNDDAPANTWLAQAGIGAGLSSGQVMRVIDSEVYSKNSIAMSYHTNVDFTAPSIVEIQRSQLITDAGGPVLGIYSLGSGQPDRCLLVGNTLGGDISYGPSPWLPTALSQQPADHSEIRVSGHSNTPAVFRNTDYGEALRIDSATSGLSSTVAVSGTAVAAIFGDGATDRLFTRGGSPGFSGAVWGWGDVSGATAGTSLGARLGDCSITNKALSITVDGGAPITVTFDQDHTAQSNATIIDLINTGLGVAGIASTWKPGAFYRPRFSDEERTLLNATGTGIPFGTVLAWDGSIHRVRPMTSADASGLFAGIAWQDIEAGRQGRVKTRGYLPISDLRRSDSGNLTFNSTMSVGGTAGVVAAGGTQGLLRAIAADAVAVRE